MQQRKKRGTSHVVDLSNDDDDDVTASHATLQRDAKRSVQVFEAVVATISSSDPFLTSKSGQSSVDGSIRYDMIRYWGDMNPKSPDLVKKTKRKTVLILKFVFYITANQGERTTGYQSEQSATIC